MTVGSGFGRVTKALSFVSIWSAILNLAGLVVLFLLIIALRLFGVSIPSADEFGSIMLASLFTFGLAAAVADDEHLDVRFLVVMMPVRLQRLLFLLAALLSVLVVGVLLQGLGTVWLAALSRGAMMLGSLPIPRALPIGVVAMGVLLFEIALVLKLITLVLPGERAMSKEPQV